MTSLHPLALALLTIPAMLLYVAAVALSKALHSYSRSRLEEYCDDRNQPERADAVAHLDERTARASELISVAAGLLAAGLLVLAVDRSPIHAGAALLAVFVVLGGLAYSLAAVVGRVFAEPLIFAAWPLARLIRTIAWPLNHAESVIEEFAEDWVGNPDSGPRPASVEVEIHAEDGESPDDMDADLPESTRTLLQHAVKLTRADVSEVMIPASAIVSLPATVSAQVASETFRKSGRSRIPLYGANRDDIIGILIGKDLWERMIENEKHDTVVPRDLVRPPFFVPETRNAFELIGDLRGHRTQMAIVLDEYGAVTGLVTLEDLLEQLVGPIVDEHDAPASSDEITALGGTRYEVDGGLFIETLNERLGLHLPTGEDYQTVAGLALSELGRLPEVGESFTADGIGFTVVEVRDHQIRRMVMDLQPVPTSTGDG
ncbi:hemolysin family protein [Aquisphaera insulae]|uniref:hemolysin family protein n=1 Tax=Aquisphaera insulae TaxID=2712864 RepID=UPI0013E9DD10|nr:hemolysin family protein [Aquisphaera insulae]